MQKVVTKTMLIPLLNNIKNRKDWEVNNNGNK